MVWAEELLYGYEEDVQVGGVLVPPAQGQTVHKMLPIRCVPLIFASYIIKGEENWIVNTLCDVIQYVGDNYISGALGIIRFCTSNMMLRYLVHFFVLLERKYFYISEKVHLLIRKILTSSNDYGTYPVRYSSNFWSLTFSEQQCRGSGMFIPDPGSWFLSIPDPGTSRKCWRKIFGPIFKEL